MKSHRVWFTVRELMVANLAVGILLGWIVCWEQFRVRELRATARAILAEDTNDPLAAYSSPQEARAASQLVGEKARMWADGWPSHYVVVAGVIVDLWMVGLALAISKVVARKVRKGRRKTELLEVVMREMKM